MLTSVSILANRERPAYSCGSELSARIRGNNLPKCQGKGNFSLRGLFLTYGGNEGCVEGVVREAEQNTGLPHARITDEEQLEQQVVRFLRHRNRLRSP